MKNFTRHANSLGFIPTIYRAGAKGTFYLAKKGSGENSVTVANIGGKRKKGLPKTTFYVWSNGIELFKSNSYKAAFEYAYYTRLDLVSSGK